MSTRRPRAYVALALGSLLALGGAAAAGFAAEADEDRPDLTVREYDTIVMKDGRTEIGSIPDDGIRADGSVVLASSSQGRTVIFKQGEYQAILKRMPAAKVVKKRGEWAFKRNDPDDVIKTIAWGRAYAAKDAELVSAAKEAAMVLAQKAMAKWPDNLDIGKVVLGLYEESGDTKSLEELARRLVKVDTHWTAGYEFVVKVLKADPARQDELVAFLNDWIKSQPTVFVPNRLLADIHEKAGQVRQAKEEYRKCYELHKDLESGLGYARTALACGEIDRALATANALAANEQYADEAKVIAGSAKLSLGDVPAAQALLQEGLKGKLSDDTAKLARYNLGLAGLRSGQLEQAREQWSQLGTPVASLGLAILDRKAFADVETLPTPALKELARVLNACVDLEHGKGGVAATLDPGASKRNLFLGLLAKLVLNGGANATTLVEELKSYPGLESQRWQVYGLLLGGKFKEADAALAELPADDGYALAYRVCVAEGLKKTDEAKEWYRKLEAAPNAPRDWVARVHALYESANDELIDEKFGWPNGDIPNGGWQYSAPGTAIHIHSLDGRLVFDGTQSASPDQVSRAWRMVREDRFKSARLELDLDGVAGATTGLEVLDDTRQNGLALGVHGDNRLAWRELKSGVWGQWQPLALQIQGTKASLCLDYNLGRMMAFMPDDPLQKFPLGDGFAKASGELCIGVFGTADPGVTWKIAALGLQIQLKPMAGPTKHRLGGG